MALLILAIFVGLVAGLARAQLNKRPLRVPAVKQIWLVLIAFAAQALILQISFTRQAIPDQIASGIFIGSQIVLLIFIWSNRRLPSLWLLGAGLFLNLLVVCLNGGWMPVSTNTISQLFPPSTPASFATGQRFGFSKDLVLAPSEIRLGILADRFLLPGWIPYRVAFSLGDILIAFGAFFLLWSIGSPQTKPVIDPTV